MADDGNLQSEVISEFSALIFVNNFGLAVSTLLFFDYFLTLRREVSEVWSSRTNATMILLFLNRYLSIAYWVLQIIATFVVTTNDTFCQFLLQGSNTFIVLANGGRLALFTLRTFAIYEKSWKILGIVGSLALANIITDIILDFGTAFVDVDINPFTNQPICNQTLGSKFTVLSWLSSLLVLTFDTIVFVLTIFKTFRMARGASRLGMRGTISYVLARDGILYYTAIEAWVIVSVCIGLIPNVPDQWKISVPFVENVLSTILTNRLIFELRRVAYGEESPSVADPLAGSEGQVGPSMLSIATMKFLGNIGETLRVDDDIDEEADMELVEVDDDTKDRDIDDVALSELSPPTDVSQIL